MPASEERPKVWFVTGTSVGLGRTLVEVLLERGELVVATLRRPSDIDEVAAKYHETLLVLPLNITDTEQISHAFTKAKERFGRIDIVVNNAAISTLGEVETVDSSDARAIIETNFWGTLSVTKEAIKFFREVNPPGVGGRILQMSSFAGFVGLPGAGYYTASKFALEGITETLAAELDPAWNIKLIIVEPGFIDTPLRFKQTWSQPHPAYLSNPNLPITQWRARGDVVAEWKDPRKSVELFYRVAVLPNPPLRLAVGRDAISGMRKKVADIVQDLDEYEAWSEGLEI